MTSVPQDWFTNVVAELPFAANQQPRHSGECQQEMTRRFRHRLSAADVVAEVSGKDEEVSEINVTVAVNITHSMGVRGQRRRWLAKVAGEDEEVSEFYLAVAVEITAGVGITRLNDDLFERE